MQLKLKGCSLCDCWHPQTGHLSHAVQDGPARSPGLMLWSVPQSLLAGHAGQHNRLNSPGFIAVDKRRYTACFIFPEGGMYQLLPFWWSPAYW